MTSVSCDFCSERATRYTQGHHLCEYHYAQLDKSRAREVALAARDNPPWLLEDRRILVHILVGMLGLEEVDEILDSSLWYRRLRPQVVGETLPCYSQGGPR